MTRKFQPTHPRKVRHWTPASFEDINGFNPRTHVRCDLDDKYGYTLDFGFNPRTHVRCDFLFSKFLSFLFGFNPRTHVRCDLPSFCNLLYYNQFQPTHPRKVRLKRQKQYSLVLRFQPTHPRKVRHSRSCCICFSFGFNPRTHVRCDTKSQSISFILDLVSTHAPT